VWVGRNTLAGKQTPAVRRHPNVNKEVGEVRLFRTLAVTAVVLAVVPAVASAVKSQNGVRPTSPGNGAVVPKGTFPTFRARVRGHGKVWINVCDHKSYDRQGGLCFSEEIDKMKKGRRSHGARKYSFKPDRYTFPSYYLQKPGTYYWQVRRSVCKDVHGRLDCAQQGKTLKFKVR